MYRAATAKKRVIIFFRSPRVKSTLQWSITVRGLLNRPCLCAPCGESEIRLSRRVHSTGRMAQDVAPGPPASQSFSVPLRTHTHLDDLIHPAWVQQA